MIDQIVEPKIGLIFFMLFGRESVSSIVTNHYEVEHGNAPMPNQVIIYDLTQGEVEFSLEDLYKNNELNKAEFEKKREPLPNRAYQQKQRDQHHGPNHQYV